MLGREVHISSTVLWVQRVLGQSGVKAVYFSPIEEFSEVKYPNLAQPSPRNELYLCLEQNGTSLGLVSEPGLQVQLPVERCQVWLVTIHDEETRTTENISEGA